MTITVKKKSTLTVPTDVQRRAGIKAGDQVEFRVSGGIVSIIPRRLSADAEYTPKERRDVNSQVTEGLDDIAKGRVSPRLNTVDEMLASMKSGRKTAPRPKKSRAR